MSWLLEINMEMLMDEIMFVNFFTLSRARENGYKYRKKTRLTISS